MAVAFDVKSTVSSNGVGVTSITTTVTVGSGANRALVAQIGWAVKTVSMTAGYPRWDDTGTPQATALINSAQNGGAAVGRVDHYGLVNPTSGNHILKAQWTGASDVYFNLFAVTGAHQTGGTTTFAHATTQTGSFGVVTMPITSAVGNMTLSLLTEDLGSISAPTQTLAFIDNALSFAAGGEYAVGAATVTHGFTVGTGGSVYAWIGVDIVAAPATPPVTLEQEGFRFRNDDGTEATATWQAAQDTTVTLPPGQRVRLRLLVNAGGDPASSQYELQYRKVGAAAWRNLDTNG